MIGRKFSRFGIGNRSGQLASPYTDNARYELWGASEAPIRVFGHSHAYCLAEAAVTNVADAKLGAVYYTRPGLQGPPDGTTYWTEASTLAQGRCAVIVWNGNQHNVHFLLRDREPFKFTGVSANLEQLDGPWIPLSMVKRLMEPTINDLIDVLSMFDLDRVALLGTPPPKAKTSIDARLGSEPYFREQAAVLGITLDELEASADLLRIGLWQVVQGQLEAVANSAGIQFIPVPSDCLEGQGVLRADFSADDVTHANVAYGQRMWSEIHHRLEGRQR